MQEVGDSLISVIVVNREGLVVHHLTRESNKSEEEEFIGAFSSLVQLILKRITQNFDIGTFGAGTFDTDKYRFIFSEAGLDNVLVSIHDPLTSIDSIFPYVYMAADKVARIFDGRPVSPFIPKIIRESELQKLKRKIDYIQKKQAYSPEYVYKLSLVGDGNVGKTSMVQRYVNGIFSEDYIATIGTFISKKECKFEDLNTSVRFMIWDLAGQEQFKRIWPDYLTDSNTGIIVFDITNKKSFENVENWYNIITRVALPSLILILAGNKIDLESSRVISTEEGEKLAEKLGIYYMETSAKTDNHIDEVFEWLALHLINIKMETLPDEIPIEKHREYIIIDSQLKFLTQYFKKQLDYCIDRLEIKKYLKLLEVLKAVEKNKL